MLQTWQGQLTSQAGRTTQIQASLSTTANYQLSIFEAPDVTHTRLNRIQRNYFWYKRNNKGCNNISWRKISRPKRYGGLGLKDTKIFNISLFAKLAWRLLNEPNEKRVQILEVRYFKGKDLLTDDTSKKRSSWIWQIIQTCLQVIKKYCI